MVHQAFLVVWGLMIAVCMSDAGSQARGNRGQQSSSAFPPPVDSSKQCSEVQVQFVQEKIGSVSLVPDQPVHGKKDFHFRKDSPMN